MDDDLHARVQLSIGADQIRDCAACPRAGVRDAQFPIHTARGQPNSFDRPVRTPEQKARLSYRYPAGVGEGELWTTTIHQRPPEFALEHLDLLTERRLGYVDVRCGASEAAVIRQSDQITGALQVHTAIIRRTDGRVTTWSWTRHHLRSEDRVHGSSTACLPKNVTRSITRLHMNPRTLTEPREPATDARLLDALAEIVGQAHVLTDPELIEGYTRDWTGRWIGDAIAVIRPGNTSEVSAVLRACFDAGVPVTPQGGNTGLVGGGIASAGSVVLSTRRLETIESVDPIGRTIAAGAGVTVARADLAASAHGLRFGIDLASKESATLGGIVATNAGGTRMVRYGNTRAQILGIEAVLADGSVLSRWTPLVKDNVGYDIPGLLAGSEGTLAVITKVLMKLVTPATDTQVVLAGVRDVDQALHLCNRVRQSGLTVEAAGIMTDDGISLVCAHTDARRPFGTPSPMYTLIEVSSPRETEESLLEVLSDSADLIEDATVEPGPARKLWTLRESHTESISASSTTPVVKLDISVPLSVMGMFIESLRETLADRFPLVRPILFGHFADGNIHVNLLDAEPRVAHELTDTVFRLVAAHHGSISAEHGIGRAKSPWISLGRTEADIAAMQLIKSSWDPRGILNPGILLPEKV